ncbi:membrane dipeptidase [Nonomuraea sp. NPDC050643]|uniref:membrane dipeptidase n=1 Tax=Nonomuraea sp. NPDC050643 TaxID=3155660 RepID=UPI0033F2A7DD
MNWAGTPGGHINARGLTEYGAILVKELISRGVVIDADHAGEKTFDAVLTICERHDYPVVAGHTSLRELRHGWAAARRGESRTPMESPELYGTANGRELAGEADKSPQQLERIRRLGGMVSLFAFQRDLPGGAAAVPDDAAGSAKSTGRALIRLSELMGGTGYGLGTDINGFGRLPGPGSAPRARPPWPTSSTSGYAGPPAGRHAGTRCSRSGTASRTPPPRPTTGPTGSPTMGRARRSPRWNGWRGRPSPSGARERLPRARSSPGPALPPWLLKRLGPLGSGLYDSAGLLSRATAGRRDFDLNMDGMAHYGLLPDFLHDLRNVGVPAAVVDELYYSAESYIRVWERCGR